MGSIVLLIALVLEAAFALYCIVTRSYQWKVRSLARLGALAAFLVLTLASVIRWSFRWYGLAALLLLWAALGAWTLLRKREAKRPYRGGRVVSKALAMLLLVAIAVTPALILPQYRPPRVTGKHPVATSSATYTDASRVETFSSTGENRKVNVTFWYPRDDGGPYPLVVFSHGAFGIGGSNYSTFMELASNGYVVCAIDHPYHSLYTIGSDRRLVRVAPSFLQEVTWANNGKYDEATVFQLERKWLALRTADIGFVLDTILAQAGAGGADAVYQRIDAKKIGLMGHSLGGAAAAEVARERSDIGAVVNLDADLLGEYVDFAAGKTVLNDKPYPVPLLTILADDLVRLMAAIPDAQATVAVEHVSASAPRAFEVHLTGTDHMSLTDLPLVSPLLVSLANATVPRGGGQEVDPHGTIEKMNGIVLAFFNAYLKGEGTFTTRGTY
jgi:dienelactone hydrolase